MAYKTDIQIAREAQKKPIQEIGAKLGIESKDLLPYGHDKAKVSQAFINSVQDRDDGKLILVTAINPTPAGEGKTTTTVGLGDGLNRIGKNALMYPMDSYESLDIDNEDDWNFAEVIANKNFRTR